jgi:hypothetical protein
MDAGPFVRVKIIESDFVLRGAHKSLFRSGGWDNNERSGRTMACNSQGGAKWEMNWESWHK